MKEEPQQFINRFGAYIMRIARRKLEHTNQEESEEGTDSNLINGLLGPLAILICVASTFGVTLLPSHNIFINPECWYELIFSTSLFHLVASTVVKELF